MTRALAAALLAGALFALHAAASSAQANLGMLALVSVHGRYLQAQADGELHADSAKRGEEETWFLVELDRARHLYALRNWRSGRFMSKSDRNCAAVAADTPGPSEVWQIIAGADFGVLDAIALRSAADGTYLGADSPGSDAGCGGEVAAGSGAEPPNASPIWAGWWIPKPATAPGSSKDPRNAKGAPADLTALFAALL